MSARTSKLAPSDIELQENRDEPYVKDNQKQKKVRFASDSDCLFDVVILLIIERYELSLF